MSSTGNNFSGNVAVVSDLNVYDKLAIFRVANQPTYNADSLYMSVKVWKDDRLFDFVEKFATKGRKFFVSGTLGQSSYESAEGEARSSLDLTLQSVSFVSDNSGGDNPKKKATKKKAQGATSKKKKTTKKAAENFDVEDVTDEDIPF